MSKLSDKIEEFIKRNLKSYSYSKEYTIKAGLNQTLRFDFCIPELKIMVEVQGNQHDNFSKFFHGTRDDFKKSQARDGFKQEWCGNNDYSLVYFNYDEIDSLTDEQFIKRIINGS
jgi:very-short-patch-repair endonuclease